MAYIAEADALAIADERARPLEQHHAAVSLLQPRYGGEAIRLDLGDTDWDAIGEWLRKSWLAVAPKKLAGLIGIADEF